MRVTAGLTDCVWHLAQSGSDGPCLPAWYLDRLPSILPGILASSWARLSSLAVSPHCTREIRCCRDTLLLKGHPPDE